MSTKISKGGAVSTRSRGLKPLLRERIFLEFRSLFSLITFSNPSILKSLRDRQFKSLLNLKNFIRQYTVLSNALNCLD